MVNLHLSLPEKRLSLILLIFMTAIAGLWAQTEICDNGVDDDGDGLIDCFDPECTCTGPCADFYYTTCKDSCTYIPPCTKISLGIQWVGDAETNTYSPLVAGDMDHDGIPDVVTYLCEGPDIYIIDGATGITKVHIVAPTIYPGGTAPAIADLDHDGYGELVIVGLDRLLRCYDHDGTLKYTSSIQVGYNNGYRFSVPNIADFDHDGWAEINIGNQVFNGQTGALLAQGGPNVSAGEHPARVINNFSFASTVAIDALPDSFCPDCKGLEIVAGNQILSVNLVTGVVAPVVSAPAPFTDGFTSVADMNGDGHLDAVVQGRKGNQNTVYCWDLWTGAILGQFKLDGNWQEGASRVNIADLNGDGKPEISFVGYPWLYALKNDFTLMWKLVDYDASSITCSSVFDFCGNGSSDIVYRGQDKLQVIDGATGAIKWEDICTSATHIENPLILDVDNDGQTEIIIECGAPGDPSHGHVVAYEAVGTPGITSRKVWNQHGYFSTNINDDLSVPRYQQNPNIVGDSVKMNAFMNQYYNPSFPTPNGKISIQSIHCVGDSLEATVQICNSGSNILPPQTPVTVYQGNPLLTAAPWIRTVLTGFSLKVDSCQNLTFRFPRLAPDSVFIVLNDNHSHTTPYSLTQHFPVTTIGECNFKDNIAGSIFPYNPKHIDLGQDTAICDHTLFTLHAEGNDLFTWSWNDGKTDSLRIIQPPGAYTVTVTDICGLTQTDHVKISIDSSTVVSIGPDHTICAGETVTLSENGFDFYNWSPSGVVNCNNCASVVAAPPTTGIVVLQAGFSNGCVNKDTVLITVRDTFNYAVDTSICYGRTVIWNGLSIPPDSSHTFALQTMYGCDSTVHIRVHGTHVGTYDIHIDTALCLGKTLPFNGLTLLPGDSKTFFLTAYTGCDSTVKIKILAKDTFATKESLVRCAGDTALFFGIPHNASGVFRKTFTAANGCDSTHTVNLTVLEPILLAIDAVPACFKETNGSLMVNVSGNAPPFAYNWSRPGNHQPLLDQVPAGTYSVTVTDHNDCTETATGAVSAYPPIEFLAVADSVRCFDQHNGSITITTPDSTLTFSLDGSSFAQKHNFPDLPAFPYQVYAQDVYGCEDTIPVPVYQPLPLVLDLPGDTTIALGETLLIRTIELGGNGQLQYTWRDTSYLSCKNCPNPEAIPLQSIRYALTITDAKGCEASDSMLVQVGRIYGLYVPNIFDPESPQLNRRFDLNCGPAIRRIADMQIYDRWGNQVYQLRNAIPNDPVSSWDGKLNGKPVPAGVYVWILQIELIDSSIIKFKGDVTVIR